MEDGLYLLSPLEVSRRGWRGESWEARFCRIVCVGGGYKRLGPKESLIFGNLRTKGITLAPPSHPQLLSCSGTSLGKSRGGGAGPREWVKEG